MKNHMKEGSGYQDNTAGLLIGFGLFQATSFAALLGLLLIWFASLRENQAFWTNAGGYPVPLRHLVNWTFVPLHFVTAFLLFGISLICFSKVCGSFRFFVLESLFLLFCWGLLATSAFIAFKNNVLNILHGSPLHRHETSGPSL